MSSPPPVLPPKPGSHEPSRHGSPSVITSPSAISNSQPAVPAIPGGDATPSLPSEMDGSSQAAADPGAQWLPDMVQNKSTKDLSAMLHSPALLAALTDAAATAPAALHARRSALLSLLASNAALARGLSTLEERLARDRAAANAQLLAAKHLERAWSQRQREADAALAPHMPAALYQRLAHGVAEQRAVCEALEESFVEGRPALGGAEGEERETAEWIKRYKEARVVYWRRKEQKDRWDEGRVGGWR
ncbi:hypothetical protein TD95_001909 [Thielaviopsis punctulata]|uniref:VPS37 C-terminal domain-containing protein n=1 Tax=Thielaviopsis punctulata TaxID=72032 RepID=A0A0F4ZHX5_9PEZI|nr:hypothetical protein TD95_001909 [Thielaviopsis punctulata]